MIKKDIVDSVAEFSGFTKKDSEIYYDTLIEIIKETLINGGDVKIPNFGNFEIRERAARKGVNPKTLENIDIPATLVPVFKPAKAFKSAIAE